MRKRWADGARFRAQWVQWRTAARVLPLLVVAALLMQDVSLSLADQKSGATEDIVVVFPHRIESSALGVLTKFNIEPTQRYTHVVDGFAASVTPEVLQQLEQIPGAIVSPDRRVEAFDDNHAGANHQAKAKGDGKHATGEGKHKHKHKHKKKNKKKKKKKNSQTSQPQITPTGVLRIAASQNPQTGIPSVGGSVD